MSSILLSYSIHSAIIESEAHTGMKYLLLFQLKQPAKHFNLRNCDQKRYLTIYVDICIYPYYFWQIETGLYLSFRVICHRSDRQEIKERRVPICQQYSIRVLERWELKLEKEKFHALGCSGCSLRRIVFFKAITTNDCALLVHVF